MAKNKIIKKQIVEYQDSIVSELEGSIDDAITYLTAKRDENPNKRFTISWEQEKYDDRYTLNLNTVRDETDEEYAVRMDEVFKAQSERDNRDRKQYEALKAKFEVNLA